MAAHPWFAPRGRRVAVTAICALWLVFESVYDPFALWFWLALAALAYALWDFFLSGNYRGTAAGTPGQPPAAR